MNYIALFLVLLLFLLPNNKLDSQQVFNSSIPEHLYVHTDRDVYIAGEEVFFKIYQILNNKTQESKYGYVIFRNNSNINIISTRVEFINNIFYGKLNLPDTLSTGIYEIIAFTNCLRNDPENSFFYKQLIIANRFDRDLGNLNKYANKTRDTCLSNNISNEEIYTDNNSLLNVNIPKFIFYKREKILLEIGLKEGNNANLSISVRRKLFGYPPQITISDYLKNTKVDIFNWQKCSYIIESKGVIIDGKVIDNSTNKPLANQIVLLSTPDSIPNLQYAYTNDEGSYKFMLSDFYFGKKIYLKLKEKANAQIIPENKYQTNLTFGRYSIDNLFELKKYITQSQDFVTIEKDYYEFSNNDEPAHLVSYKKFPYVYAKPYSSVRPSDYFELPDFIEISREILPTLKIRKLKNEYTANMLNIHNNYFMTGSPLIFLDGIPIDNINQVIQLGSAKIKSIETYPTERHIGSLVFDGILSINTNQKEISNIKFENPVISYLELNNQPFSTWNSKNININEKNYPNYKQLLYWEPNITIKPEKQITFYAPDNTGYFVIDIQGITSDGKPISIQKTIQIINK